MTSPQLSGSLKVILGDNHYKMAQGANSGSGIKAKVENKGQYDEYLRELEPIREELGINLKEHMYPDA